MCCLFHHVLTHCFVSQVLKSNVRDYAQCLKVALCLLSLSLSVFVQFALLSKVTLNDDFCFDIFFYDIIKFEGL